MVTCPGEAPLPERRPNDAASHVLARRLRAMLEPAEPPVRRRKAPRLDPVRRSSMSAAWQARSAVRAGMPLDDFLRARLARYLVDLPVPAARLPVSVSIEDGQILARPAPAPAPPDASAAAPGAPTADPGEPSARHEAAELEVRVAVLDGQIEDARHRTEEIAHRFAADVATGIVAAPPGVDATAEQMGRPPVRGAGPRGALVALVLSALAAEAWQSAVPLLAGGGLDPARVGAALADRPGDVASLVLFAVGITAALFVLAHGALAAGSSLLAGEPDPGRRAWLAGAGGAASVLAVAVSLAVAALPRPGLPPAPSGLALALLLLAVPVGAALVLRAVSRLAAARGEELARALAWDRERALAIAERSRRLEELRWAEDEEADLERQREVARRRLRELDARALALARLSSETAEQERAGLARLAQGVVAVLELDRYAYVRLASARGGEVPARRRSPEPRPGGFEPPAPARPSVEVETGRLAS